MGFYVNPEALADNKFINEEWTCISKEESTRRAIDEFETYVENLTENGIEVEIFDQTVEAADSVFPDWFITARNEYFPKGVLILSAMKN
jgi:hypothetical protein